MLFPGPKLNPGLRQRTFSAGEYVDSKLVNQLYAGFHNEEIGANRMIDLKRHGMPAEDIKAIAEEEAGEQVIAGLGCKKAGKTSNLSCKPGMQLAISKAKRWISRSSWQFR